MCHILPSMHHWSLCNIWGPYFVNAFILWSNLALTNLRGLSHTVLHFLRARLRVHGPRPQDAVTPTLLLMQIFVSNYAVLATCLQRAPGAGLKKRSNFSTVIVGLAGNGGDRTQAAWSSDTQPSYRLRHPLRDWFKDIATAGYILPWHCTLGVGGEPAIWHCCFQEERREK
jgi:hypothetical protein